MIAGFGFQFGQREPRFPVKLRIGALAHVGQYRTRFFGPSRRPERKPLPVEGLGEQHALWKIVLQFLELQQGVTIAAEPVEGLTDQQQAVVHPVAVSVPVEDDGSLAYGTPIEIAVPEHPLPVLLAGGGHVLGFLSLAFGLLKLFSGVIERVVIDTPGNQGSRKQDDTEQQDHPD